VLLHLRLKFTCAYFYHLTGKMGTTVMQKLAANRFTIAVVLLEIMFVSGVTLLWTSNEWWCFDDLDSTQHGTYFG
jgi:hypothetical protein